MVQEASSLSMNAAAPPKVVTDEAKTLRKVGAQYLSGATSSNSVTYEERMQLIQDYISKNERVEHSEGKCGDSSAQSSAVKPEEFTLQQPVRRNDYPGIVEENRVMQYNYRK